MKHNSKFALILSGSSFLGCALMILAASSTAAASSTPSAAQQAQESAGKFIRTTGRVPSLDTDFTKAAENTINCVVSIKSYATPQRQQFQSGSFMDPFEFFFGPGFGGNDNLRRQQPQQKQQEDAKPQPLGLGSGVIISADGYIVTNNHVIKGAEKLEVTLNNNKSYNAKVIGADENTDIALLKIEAKDLPVITFGDSDGLKVGEWVLAVGNPFGFTSTVTAGIVSAKARDIGEAVSSGSRSLESFIQTDAAVNPGNSGGALVNTNGELVGINTAIYSNTGNYTGYSFAIPSATVKKVVTDLKQYGAVQRAVLGISFTPLTADMATEKNIKATSEGLYVAKVTDRGAAMEAGIKEGDVITRINGNPVKSTGQMMEQMNRLRPGDKIAITYIRDNKTASATAILKNNQGSTSVTKSADMMSLGCAFKELSAQKKKELQVSSGIEVVGIKEGKFRKAGIKDGFVITDINNSPVSTRDDVENIYNAIMRDTQSDKVMFITGMYPTGKKVYYAVDLSDN